MDPDRERLTVGGVEVEEPARRVGAEPGAELQPLRVRVAIDLAGDPAHAHAAAHATTAHAATTHAAHAATAHAATTHAAHATAAHATAAHATHATHATTTHATAASATGASPREVELRHLPHARE